MKSAGILSDRARLITIIWLLLGTGFIATSLVSYVVSRDAIRESIIATELPLTSDNVYSEIQKDLVRPILISSMMASDTFLRDWVIAGERDVEQMSRYLSEVLTRFGAVTSFFVSEASHKYYTGKGILKTVREGALRDAWYFRVRDMKEAYEINVDPDLAHGDAMTIFINYRVHDYKGRYIGATGVGLTVDDVNRLIDDYQQRYGRMIYLVDAKGEIRLAGKNAMQGQTIGRSIHDIDGLRDHAHAILKAGKGSFEYQSQNHQHYLNVRYIPELHWYLFVVKQEDKALGAIQRTLYLNLLLCVLITAVVLIVVHITLNRYQKRLETMATTDNLTGLANRHALDILLGQRTHEIARHNSPMSAIMLDIDHFKSFNDHRGHIAGDQLLKSIADTLRENLRVSDIACRWGGEEFLIILTNTDLPHAADVANALRERIEQKRHDIDGSPAAITVSAGVVAYQPGESPESFVNRADALLYQAKSEGRNRVCSESGGGDALDS